MPILIFHIRVFGLNQNLCKQVISSFRNVLEAFIKPQIEAFKINSHTFQFLVRLIVLREKSFLGFALAIVDFM